MTKPGDPIWARINGVSAKGVISYTLPDSDEFWNVTLDTPVGKSKGPKMTYMVRRDSVLPRG